MHHPGVVGGIEGGAGKDESEEDVLNSCHKMLWQQNLHLFFVFSLPSLAIH